MIAKQRKVNEDMFKKEKEEKNSFFDKEHKANEQTFLHEKAALKVEADK